MKILGLTGGIACGKSSVAQMLAGFGAQIIDADQLVRELYSDAAFARSVAELFEDASLLTPQNTVDRDALGLKVFKDAAALRRLEVLVHPAVAALREEKLRALRQSESVPPAVVLEAVKLIESGQARGCDAVWCLTCAPAMQLERMMHTRGLSAIEAWARMEHQPPIEGKPALLQQSAGAIPFVLIENNGTREELEAKVAAEWQALMAQSQQL